MSIKVNGEFTQSTYHAYDTKITALLVPWSASTVGGVEYWVDATRYVKQSDAVRGTGIVGVYQLTVTNPSGCYEYSKDAKAVKDIFVNQNGTTKRVYQIIKNNSLQYYYGGIVMNGIHYPYSYEQLYNQPFINSYVQNKRMNINTNWQTIPSPNNQRKSMYILQYCTNSHTLSTSNNIILSSEQSYNYADSDYVLRITTDSTFTLHIKQGGGSTQTKTFSTPGGLFWVALWLYQYGSHTILRILGQPDFPAWFEETVDLGVTSSFIPNLNYCRLASDESYLTNMINVVSW